MKKETITLLIMLAVLIFFIILGIIFWNYQPPSTPVQIRSFQLDYFPFGFWGGNQSTTDTTRNTCQLYQFEGQMETIGGQLMAVPANSTLNPEVLNALTPQPNSGCYDVDQIIAAQVQHTCVSLSDFASGDFVGTNPPPSGSQIFCVAADGQRSSLGTTEVYYTQDSSLFDAQGNPSGSLQCSTQKCNGTLNFLAFNYQPGGPELIYDIASCMSIDNTDPTNPVFSAKTCDIGDQTQIFRVNQAMPQSNTTASQDTQDADESGKVGVVATLYHRASGLLVVPNADITGLTLANNFEKIWALVPQLFGSTVASPQQIVYVGDLTSDQIAQFNAVLNYTQLLNLIIGTNRKSIQLDGNGGFVLAPFVTYPRVSTPTPADYLASFQPVNYVLFNQTLFTTQPTVF